MFKQIGLATALLGTALGLSACATDGYGYGGVDAGYAGYYGGDPYDDGFGPGYGYGYAGYGFGWYDGFYYPGNGLYVYDRYRHAYPLNGAQRRYWASRPGFGNPQVRANWVGFRDQVAAQRGTLRGDLRTNRQAYQAGTITRDQFRQGRQDARQDFRQGVRQDVQGLRQENRAQGFATPRPSVGFRPGGNRGFGFGGGRGGGGHFGGGGGGHRGH